MSGTTDTAIPALLFGPGLPLTGQRCTLRAASDHVEVSWSGAGPGATTIEDAFDGSAVTAAIGEVTFADVGFGKPGLELRWPVQTSQMADPAAARMTDPAPAPTLNASATTHWLAHVLNPVDAAALRARADWAALPSLARLLQRHRRQRTQRLAGWAAVALLVLSPLLLLGLFLAQAHRLAAVISERIPVAEEVRLGRQAFEAMRGELKLQDQSTAHEAVAAIGGRLTTGSRYPYEFHVVEDATLNAFALPGGIVVVHTGLIAATRRPEELAGVLAHEVQHVELRHGTTAIVKDLGWRMLLAWFTGDWGGTLAGQAAAELGSLKFSRDAEADADRAGFDRLVQVGIDPSGMADFLATMAKQSPAAPAAFLSTHPGSEEREQALRQSLAALPTREFTPLQLTLPGSAKAGTWPPSSP